MLTLEGNPFMGCRPTVLFRIKKIGLKCSWYHFKEIIMYYKALFQFVFIRKSTKKQHFSFFSHDLPHLQTYTALIRLLFICMFLCEESVAYLWQPQYAFVIYLDLSS